jgi:hypothetical protein
MYKDAARMTKRARTRKEEHKKCRILNFETLLLLNVHCRQANVHRQLPTHFHH